MTQAETFVRLSEMHEWLMAEPVDDLALAEFLEIRDSILNSHIWRPE